ncbi:hypothetical protein SPOG_03037 [Schizosaccharomyces cryophilus OY26]|uniref:Uncharacterized protein n=1 Tax=Schizosaccharomyces cryophilus (strain OY26 / ATCC MYA-4695 / CBS 11777 / NBRC 106824 / NRRL Y48691) TaxID=653667 RepID=S9W763_SCHCR|nr:uncharacterized protein SPOG_03037 [Schizosaccharomyces cryophilus OY26]EPY53730.1 hypothetical protein SPOG_03037 [Schizosaccharomyces cryophilus OY26]
MEGNTAKVKLYWNDNESIVADVLLKVNTGDDKSPIPILNLNNKIWSLLNCLEVQDDSNELPSKHANSVSNLQVSARTSLTPSKQRIPLKTLTDEEKNTNSNIHAPVVTTPSEALREQPTIGDENAFSSPTKSYHLGNKQGYESANESFETFDLQGWFTVENDLDQTSPTQQERESISEASSDYDEIFDDLCLKSENVESCIRPSRRNSYSLLLDNGSFTTLSMSSNDIISTSSLNEDNIVSPRALMFDLTKDIQSSSSSNHSEFLLEDKDQVSVSNEEEAPSENPILPYLSQSFALENDCLYYIPQLLHPCSEINLESFEKSRSTKKIWLMLKAKTYFDEMEHDYSIPLNFLIPTFRVEFNLKISSSFYKDWNAHVSSGHFDTQLEQASNVSKESSFYSSAPLSASSLLKVVWYTKESLKSVKVSETTVSVFSFEEDDSSSKQLYYDVQCLCASNITENSIFILIAPESFVIKNVFSDSFQIEFEQQRNGDEIRLIFTKVHDQDNKDPIKTLNALQIRMMNTDTNYRIRPIPIVKHMKHPMRVSFENLISDYQVCLYDIYGNLQTLALGCCEFIYNKEMKYGFTLTQRKQSSEVAMQNPFIPTSIKRSCTFPVFRVFNGVDDYLQLVFSCTLVSDPEEKADILKLKLPDQSRLTWVIEGNKNYLTNIHYSDGIYGITNYKMKQCLSIQIGILVPLQKTTEGTVFRLPVVLDYTLNHVVVDMDGVEFMISAMEVNKRIQLKPLKRLEFRILRNASVLFTLEEEKVKCKRTALLSHAEADNDLKPEPSNLLKETLTVCFIVGYLLMFYQVFIKQI